MSKPLPKSLHTITALIRVARNEQALRVRLDLNPLSNEDAVVEAMKVFGYSVTNDPSGLVVKSLASMDAEDAKRVGKAVA